MLLNIGVLAFHGAFVEHEKAIKRAFDLLLKSHESQTTFQYDDITLSTVLVKRLEHFQDLHGLIIPGGESTVMSKFMAKDGFIDVMKNWMAGSNSSGDGGPSPLVWGTCAGLILLANDVKQKKDGGQLMIGGIDIRTNRNIFMRQNSCFEDTVKLLNTDLRSGSLSQSEDYPGVFINPPTIEAITGSDVEVLAEYKQKDGNTIPIAVRQGKLMAASFHPELTEDYRWHEYFLRCTLHGLQAKS